MSSLALSSLGELHGAWHEHFSRSHYALPACLSLLVVEVISAEGNSMSAQAFALKSGSIAACTHKYDPFIIFPIHLTGGADCSALCSEEVAKDPKIVEVARVQAANALMHREGLNRQLQLVSSAHHTARMGQAKAGKDTAGGFAV